jgi:branched-chain amino acid transport system ATP-binding protein
MTLLALEGVGKSFGGLRALHEIGFTVAEGEILGIMGANGAGKTTLFSLIAGHERPTRGRILLRGRRIDGLRPDRICRAGIARTFQIVRPFPALTVRENATTAALFGRLRLRDRAAADRVAMEAIEEVGLGPQAGQPAAALTLSAQKRLEIARALATGPELLLLDEVMAGLTATEVSELLAAIAAITRRRGLTVLIVEHVMQALMRLSDRIVVLHHGEMIAAGPPQAVAADPRVIEAYLGRGANP